MIDFDKKYFEECVAKAMMNVEDEEYLDNLVTDTYMIDGIVAELLNLAICCIKDGEEINAKNLIYNLNYKSDFIDDDMIENWFDGYCIMLIEM